MKRRYLRDRESGWCWLLTEMEDLGERVRFFKHWWGYNPSLDKDGPRAQGYNMERKDFDRRYELVDQALAYRINPDLARLG